MSATSHLKQKLHKALYPIQVVDYNSAIQKMEEHDGIIFLNPGSVLDNNYAIVLEDKIVLK